jgi:hypothetical protein
VYSHLLKDVCIARNGPTIPVQVLIVTMMEWCTGVLCVEKNSYLYMFRNFSCVFLFLSSVLISVHFSWS